MAYKFTEREAKIFDAVKNCTFDKPGKIESVENATGIKRRMILINIRQMNEKFKKHFFIGTSKDRGVWMCKTEDEAIYSLIAYNKTIMGSLGEYKRMKNQIQETFGLDRDLFGQRILSQNV